MAARYPLDPLMRLRGERVAEEKFALDVWYADHWSLLLDARILIETVGRVLKRDGVSSDGHATMPEFMGSPVGT